MKGRSFFVSIQVFISLFVLAVAIFSPIVLSARANTVTSTDSSQGTSEPSATNTNSNTSTQCKNTTSVLSSAWGDPLCLDEKTTITSYLVEILKRYRGLILSVMTLYVVISGVQYMLSRGNSDAQKQAKQRIGGMVAGIIFFTLINLLVATLGGIR